MCPRPHRNDRVDQNRKVWTAADVFRGVSRLGVAVIKVRCGGCGQMTSGRKSDDADPHWINRPLRGMRSYRADRALSVE